MNVHEKVAEEIIQSLLGKIEKTKGRYILSVAGESGCGKTETSKALEKELKKNNVGAVILGQDNYFFFPPSANDAKRKANMEWLGPHKEVNLELMEKHILEAKNDAEKLNIPYIEYESNEKSVQVIDIESIKVIIVEGTYTSLLRNLDTRIFIDENYKETLQFRKIRNRGNEVDDPFVEMILETEHKIIAGHKFLADIIISKDYDVTFN